MTRPFIALGSVPCKEAPARFGDTNFRLNAVRDCQAYIQAIRNYLGQEPDGAELECKAFDGDRGLYYEVVCSFHPENSDAEAYAQRCERQAPHTWAEGGVRAPRHVVSGSRVRSGG